MEIDGTKLLELLASLQRPDCEPGERKQADESLRSFQRTRRAWEVALEALQMPSAPASLRFFAAQTLRQKAGRDSILGTSTHNSSPHKDTQSVTADPSKSS